MTKGFSQTFFKKQLLLLFLVFVGFSAFAQTVVIEGKILDSEDNSPLIGAKYIVADQVKGGYAEEDGSFRLEINRVSVVRIAVNYVGYQDSIYVLNIPPEQSEFNLDLILESKIEGVMGEVVEIAGRREQDQKKIVNTVFTMDQKPVDLQAKSDIEGVLKQSPGVDIIDGQPSIRGSSGYANGVGSRVMLMLNGLPLLSPDAGIAMFEIVPTDNIHQIEIMKGASSVLYGSSALGGVINITTKDAPIAPKTSIRLSSGFYDNPANPALDWDSTQHAWFAHTNVFHSRRINNNDLTILADVVKNTGWRKNTDQEQARFMVMTKFRPKKAPGLNWGFNASTRVDSSGTFLWWDTYLPDSITGVGGGLVGDSTLRRQLNTRITIDPFIKFLTKGNVLHTYRGRIMRAYNQNSTNQSSINGLYYNDYQVMVGFLRDSSDKARLNLVSGVTGIFNEVNGVQLYGRRRSSLNGAAYFQADAEISPRWNISVGARYDHFLIDFMDTIPKVESAPSFRGGLNYACWRGGNLRASFGQGFRSPAVTERFLKTASGGSNFVGNPNLNPERGYSTEIGIRQGFMAGNPMAKDKSMRRGWKGFVDAAVFMMDFRDMIEVGVQGLPLVDILNGIQPSLAFTNVARARITGAEATLVAQGDFGNFTLDLTGGTTYIQPRNLNAVPDSLQVDLSDGDISDLFAYFLEDDNPQKKWDNPSFLKYRSTWTNRLSVTGGYKKWSLSTNIRHRSPIESIDQILFLAIPGIPDWYDSHPEDSPMIVDIILGHNFNDAMRLSLHIDNAFNEEWVQLPGILSEQRKFTLQFKVVFDQAKKKTKKPNRV